MTNGTSQGREFIGMYLILGLLAYCIYRRSRLQAQHSLVLIFSSIARTVSFGLRFNITHLRTKLFSLHSSRLAIMERRFVCALHITYPLAVLKKGGRRVTPLSRSLGPFLTLGCMQWRTAYQSCQPSGAPCVLVVSTLWLICHAVDLRI